MCRTNILHTIPNSPHSPSESPGILNSAHITDCRNRISWTVCWINANICFVFWGALARILLWHLAWKILGITYIPQYFSPFRYLKTCLCTFSVFLRSHSSSEELTISLVTPNTILSMTSTSKNCTKSLFWGRMSFPITVNPVTLDTYSSILHCADSFPIILKMFSNSSSEFCSLPPSMEAAFGEDGRFNPSLIQ